MEQSLISFFLSYRDEDSENNDYKDAESASDVDENVKQTVL